MADATVPNKPIKTKRLILREARIYDLGAVHELYSNKEVMRYWSPPFDSIARTKSYLETMVTSPNNGVLAFVIILPPSPSPSPSPSTSNTPNTHPKPSPSSTTHPTPTPVDEGTLIGHAGIWLSHPAHPSRTNELVFMLHPSYWNQGFMTEALETLVPVFWKRGPEKVFADVEVGNVASGMVLRRCGFRVVEGGGGGGVVEMGEGGGGGGGSWECERMEMGNPNGEGWEGEGKAEGEGEGEGDGDGDDDRGNGDKGRA